jgi:hypothetical protein
MLDRKVVPFDEFYYQLKLMQLFLLHPVCNVIHLVIPMLALWNPKKYGVKINNALDALGINIQSL